MKAATERRRTSEALLELRSHHRSRGARNLLSMLERRRNWPIAGAIDHLRDPEASRPQMVMWSSPVS